MDSTNDLKYILDYHRFQIRVVSSKLIELTSQALDFDSALSVMVVNSIYQRFTVARFQQIREEH